MGTWELANLIFALSVEVVLLFLIILVLLLAFLGIFLPILPAILFLGLAMGIYTLMIKNGYDRISGRFHPRLKKIYSKIFKFKVVKNIFNYFNTLAKARKHKKNLAKLAILKFGFILLGLNVSLGLIFCFSFIFISILAALMDIEEIFFVFFPLALIFIFSGLSAVLWYRFGQILGNVFKENKVLNSILAVLISFLPLILVFAIVCILIGNLGLIINGAFMIMFLGFFLLSILAGAFELLIVNLGAITSVK